MKKKDSKSRKTALEKKVTVAQSHVNIPQPIQRIFHPTIYTPEGCFNESQIHPNHSLILSPLRIQLNALHGLEQSEDLKMLSLLFKLGNEQLLNKLERASGEMEKLCLNTHLWRKHIQLHTQSPVCITK